MSKKVRENRGLGLFTGPRAGTAAAGPAPSSTRPEGPAAVPRVFPIHRRRPVQPVAPTANTLFCQFAVRLGDRDRPIAPGVVRLRRGLEGEHDDPITWNGKRFVTRQGNNSYIFPGVGLGAIAVRAARITDAMFMAAARTLASTVTESDLAQGSLYPPLSDVRRVSARIAAAVAEVAYAGGLAQIERPADLLEYVQSHMYDPRYPTYA